MSDERDAGLRGAGPHEVSPDGPPLGVRMIWTIMQAVMLLHDRGYHRLRFSSGMSPSGMQVRVQVEWVEQRDGPHGVRVVRRPVATSSFGDWNGTGWRFAGATIAPDWTASMVADQILIALGEQEPSAVDPDYVDWLGGLHEQCVLQCNVPVAFADDRQDRSENWEIGWGRSVLYPAPPPVPGPNMDRCTGQ